MVYFQKMFWRWYFSKNCFQKRPKYENFTLFLQQDVPHDNNILFETIILFFFIVMWHILFESGLGYFWFTTTKKHKRFFLGLGKDK